MTSPLVTKVSSDLAQLNRDVLAHRCSLGDFIATWVPYVSAPAIGDTDPGSWVQAQGLVRSSLERHAIAAGVSPSVVAAFLPDDDVVLRMAGDGPPRDVLGRYVHGPGFLDVPAESRFKTGVVLVGGAYATALEALQPLTDGRNWARHDAVERLHAAEAAFHLSNQAFRRMARAPEEVRREFADDVRGFFQPRVVGGELYGGINAAHEWRVAVADVVLGSDDAEYRAYLAGIAKHFLPSGLRAFMRAQAHGSLRLALAEHLGVDDVIGPEARDAGLLGGPSLRRVVTAYAQAVNAHAGVSGAHGGVIRTHLESLVYEPAPPARALSEAIGSGGRTHEATARLHEMRRAYARALHTTFSYPKDPEDKKWPTPHEVHAPASSEQDRLD